MNLIPLPYEKKYVENGPVRQKLGRILLYIIQKYSAGADRNYPEYAQAHALIYAAWERLNADLEFCEQIELMLPVWHEPPAPSPSPGDPEGDWLGAPSVVIF